MPEVRKLAAIMFTDIVGYTALMGSDEDQDFYRNAVGDKCILYLA